MLKNVDFSSFMRHEIPLQTGDRLTQFGSQLTIEMPSGERLSIDGKNWTLTDQQGNVIASNIDDLTKKNPSNGLFGGRLENGAYVDRIIPFRGPDMWTLNYPNGDRVAIRNGKVAITRGNRHCEYGVSDGQAGPNRVDW